MAKKGESKDMLISKRMESQLPTIKEYSHEDLDKMSNIYFKSKLIPEHLKSPESVYIAMRWALALGIDPFLGLRDIFIIDNIPSIRTEAAIALVESSGFCEYIEQTFIGTPYDDSYTAICTVRRKGRKEHISTFSVKDAKDAKLWGKKTKTGADTTWITYKKRMLMYRAVGFALRDIFPDVLRGAKLYEEVIDYSQYTVIEDASTSGNINVKVINTEKSSGGSGLSKVMSIMNEEPPED
jgi:hypothetical protein